MPARDVGLGPDERARLAPAVAAADSKRATAAAMAGRRLSAAAVGAALGVALLLAAARGARPLRDPLVRAPLYNLIFPQAAPPLDVTAVITSTAERKRPAAAVSSVPSDRAVRLSRWLSPP